MELTVHLTVEIQVTLNSEVDRDDSPMDHNEDSRDWEVNEVDVWQNEKNAEV